MRRWFAVALGVVVAGACSDSYGTGNGNDGGGGPSANQVFMQSTAFNPSTRTVATGTTVTWSNKDGFAHTVTSSSVPSGAQSFSSGNLGGGATFQVTFSTAGTYQYFCSIHGTATSGMRGTVVVQ